MGPDGAKLAKKTRNIEEKFSWPNRDMNPATLK
jgi:hypothetical protein